MSYNTRRSGGYSTGPAPQNQQHSVGNIGQRRPVVTNNFVPGGQLNTQNKPSGAQQANPQQRPPMQMQQQQKAQNPNTSVNFRNQQNQGYQQPQQQQAPPPQQQQPAQQPQIKPETPAPPSKMPQEPADPKISEANGQPMETSDESVPKKRPFWARAGAGNKISKKEKMRRRNVRLSKILQPKNAVMILNELVKNTSYVVDEVPVKVDSNQFKASVLVDGIEHAGLGRSKIHAKNSAAETALKYLIKSNKLTEMKTDEEGNEKMDVSEDDTQQSPLPWQHFASFALYKLFTSWGEDPNIVKGSKGPAQLNNSGQGERQHENRPAKKMPPNPETINPLMLINQMLPHAQFEEIGKSGNPPNVTYSYRCTVDDQNFIGTGPNKKAAKKLAAFGACHKVLEVNYPTDVYVPIY